MSANDMARKELEQIVDDDFPADFFEVRPVKVDNREGRDDVEYTWTELHIEELENFSVAIPSVVSGKCGNTFFWKYASNPMVVLTRHDAYAHKHATKQEGCRQAYFALSYLDSRAKVSGWRKA